jgi:hypothetical protein
VPIITFLRDVFSMAKGPYHRKIGKHTQRFCSNAAKYSRNEVQKRIFLVAAICADEFIATLLRLENKRPDDPFKGRTLQNKIAKQQVTGALRIYMSAILTLISSRKDVLLQKTGMQEQELLHMWCSMFEYLPPDIKVFNEWMLPVYQQDGIDGLNMLVGKNVIDLFFIEKDALSLSEAEALQKIIVEDAAAVVRILQTDSVEAL